MKNINKYLTHYAEPCIKALDHFPTDIMFTHSVVIPAYKESVHFVERYINSVLAEQPSLMVLVINQPDYDANVQPQQSLFNNVCALGELRWAHGAYTLITINNSQASVLIIDSYSYALPERQGVGLARKQGVDSALALIANKNIQSEWICSTDADATLPDSYFEALSTLNSDDIGACFNFYHQCEDVEVHQANALYEQALRYYVDGLSYAGSHYNYFTIGSILSFTAKAYANVRGFPKRSAGEDFYLLNKLAKLGDVAYLKDHTVKLTARRSDRVPFGTGPAVNRIIELQHQQKAYCYYHPQVFVLLKEVLTAFTSVFDYLNNIEPWLAKLSPHAKSSLLSLGFNDFIAKQHSQQSAQQKKLVEVKQANTQFNKQLIVWFDAFKTLKFIHFAKANYWPDIPLAQAIAQAPFIMSNTNH